MAREILSSDVLPEHYELTLEPDLESFSFQGTVLISCDVHVATDSISVHAHELLISHASFKSTSGAVTAVESIALKVKSKLVACRSSIIVVIHGMYVHVIMSYSCVSYCMI